MNIKDLVLYGDSRLTTKAADIDLATIDDDFRNLAQSVYKFLCSVEGLGLAANQIGDNRNFFILHDSILPKNVGVVFINPRIIGVSGNETIDFEGCLSLLFSGCDVSRDDAIVLEYENISGETVKLEAEGLLARVIQHEVEHLQGKMITDGLSRLKRDRIIKKFKKTKAGVFK